MKIEIGFHKGSKVLLQCAIMIASLSATVLLNLTNMTALLLGWVAGTFATVVWNELARRGH